VFEQEYIVGIIFDLENSFHGIAFRWFSMGYAFFS
jgi:hypothetical protein